MTNHEMRSLIFRSFLRTPCAMCQSRVHNCTPDSLMRCDDCGSSLRQRWQVQRRIEVMKDDPRYRELFDLRRELDPAFAKAADEIRNSGVLSANQIEAIIHKHVYGVSA